jgi:peroxiredoxin Q/BCP
MRALAKLTVAACLLTVCTFLAGAAVVAQEKEGVKVGDKAPAFQATDDQGKEWKSADHVGKKVLVLYFFPADFTGGCTAQACGFRDNIAKLADKGITVIGISGDSAKTHALFKAEHKLPFTLLADERGDLAKTFGIPVSKGGTIKINKDGEQLPITRGVTISRYTVIIDRDGNVAAKYQVGKAAADSQKVLETVQKLQAK